MGRRCAFLFQACFVEVIVEGRGVTVEGRRVTIEGGGGGGLIEGGGRVDKER